MKVTLGLCTATMILLAARAANTDIQSICTSEEIISLSLGVGTNETGHVILNGRLDKPQGNGTWQLDVQYGKQTCSAKQPQTKFITFKASGGYVKGTSSSKKPPLGYTLFPEMGYFRASKLALTWQAAKEACQRDGAHLATAESQQEAEFLATQFSFQVADARSASYAWYGASDIAQEGKFVTVTGTLLNETGFATFHPGQPAGGTIENCLIMYKDKPVLDDVPCSWQLAYICKVPT